MIRNQIKYEMQIYFTGSSFVMPIVFIAIFLYSFYSVKPLDVMSGYMMTCIFTFLLLTWVGMTQTQRENAVMEQVLYLKMRKAWKYYLAKALFLMILALLVSIICTLFPVIQNQINGGDMFLRPLTLNDICNAFLLMTGCGMCGAALGNLLHKRVIFDRKVAITMTALLAIMSICEKPITDEFPALKFVTWVLPQIMLPQKIYADMEYFNLSYSLGIFGILLLYTIAYLVLKSIICHKHKF